MFCTSGNNDRLKDTVWVLYSVVWLDRMFESTLADTIFDEERKGKGEEEEEELKERKKREYTAEMYFKIVNLIQD